MRSVSAVLAVACVILVAGASFAYLYDSGVGFDAERNSDGTVTVDVSGALPAGVTYHVFSGTSVPEMIYLYLDEDYCGDRISYREQSRNLGAIETLLANRGYTSVEYIDAAGLARIVADASAAPVSGIMMMSGSVPETVFPDDSRNGLAAWIAGGGTLYWSGPDMGKFRATSDGKTVETGCGGMFGEYANFSDSEHYFVSEAGEISSEMGFSNGRAEFGLSVSYTGSTMKVLGLSDGRFSSLSVVSVGAGRVYVLGTDLSSLEVESLCSYADIIASGINENTVVKGSGSFDKGYGTCSCSTDVSVSHGDAVYVTSGKPVTEKGRLFVF